MLATLAIAAVALLVAILASALISPGGQPRSMTPIRPFDIDPGAALTHSGS